MDNLDPELTRFVEQMEQSARLEKMKQKLTEDCWNVCVTNPNVSKFDYKTESCLANCVERFIDSSAHIIQVFSNKLQTDPTFGNNGGGGFSGSSSTFSDPEMILEDKFGSGASPQPKETPKKSGWW